MDKLYRTVNPDLSGHQAAAFRLRCCHEGPQFAY